MKPGNARNSAEKAKIGVGIHADMLYDAPPSAQWPMFGWGFLSLRVARISHAT